MKKHLVEQVFKIQEQINKVLPDPEECEWVDSGMFVDPKNSDRINVLWRDNSYEYRGSEHSFTWSTAGDYKGDLPADLESQVMEILTPLKKKAPFQPVSNIDDVK